MTGSEISGVNTKVPYRIDVHHHVMPGFFLDALSDIGARTMFGLKLPDWTLEAHLRVMDKNKIAIGIASIPPDRHLPPG